MKDKIKNLLKTNRFIYKIYYLFFSNFLRFIGLFIRIDKHLILINSFGGKKYDDSPKAIFEYMLTNKKYKKYTIIWAFENPDLHEIKNAKKIKTDTLKYWLTALKAKYWITNSAIERGLKFKKKETIYINTWHGTPIKKMGIDIASDSTEYKTSPYDVFYVQSQFDIDVFKRAFNLKNVTFARVGLPRNDELSTVSSKDVLQIKKKLKLPLDKKIILYAPTFREYKRDSKGCVIAPPIDINKWKDKLADEYIVLFRAHYEIYNVLGIEDDEFMYNMSSYPYLNELMKISDILISDYSSIMFDYSVLGRPIFSYAYDYDEYKEKRGMYFEIKDELPNGCYMDEDILIQNIVECNYKVQKQKTKIFASKYIQFSGKASKYIDNIIKD